MKKFRTIFMGTPDFSVPCLARLAEITEIIGVVTQPDKPRGRGQKLTPSPVKAFAMEKGFTVYQPAKIKTEEFTRILKDLHPDLMVVVAFGQILSQQILDIPAYGCINVHASLLPRYRGAAPIQWSVINGEKLTGVTTMFMDAGLDTGDMLLKTEVPITEDMIAEELHDALMEAGADLLVKTVAKIADGTIQRIHQADADSNYAPMLSKETGHIDWTKPAWDIHNLVRGLNSWPGAYSILQGKTFKIWRTRVADAEAVCEPGEILELTKQGFLAGTGKGILEILEIQAPNKKKMAASDYVRGHGLELHLKFEA